MRTHETNWAGNYTYTAAELCTPAQRRGTSADRRDERSRARARLAALLQRPRGHQRHAHLAARHARRDRCRRRCPVGPGVCRSHLRAARVRPELGGAGPWRAWPHCHTSPSQGPSPPAPTDRVTESAHSPAPSAPSSWSTPTAQHRTVALGGPDFEGHVVSLGALGHRHPPHPGRRACLRRTPGRAPRACAGPTCRPLRRDHSAAPTASASSPTGSTPRPTQVWLKSRDGGRDVTAGARRCRRHGDGAHTHAARRSAEGADRPARRGRPVARAPAALPDGVHPEPGAELQSEYFVPRRHAAAACAALRASRRRFEPLLQVSEIRTLAADQLWLSGAHDRGHRRVPLHLGARPTCRVRRPARASRRPWTPSALARTGGSASRCHQPCCARSTRGWRTSPSFVRGSIPSDKFANPFLDRCFAQS